MATPESDRKTFVGPRMRQLRKQRGQTQSEMARALGISPTYVNLLENNQRSLSLKVLMRLSETYGVDWRDLIGDDGATLLADLRNAVQDPIFGEERPDLQELRGALDHAPRLARSLLQLHKAYRTLSERVLARAPEADAPLLAATPEAVVHDLFRRNRNHFPALEEAARRLREEADVPADEVYGYLKQRLANRSGIDVQPLDTVRATDPLRLYDEANGCILLSPALDHPNRVFQLTHMIGLLEFEEVIATIIEEAGIDGPRDRARCRVELANYFAAAVLMPYERFLKACRESRYDLDVLAATFGVSFEQVCHRATTLQREGATGVPFFFLRIDKAGNVSKRFNATGFHLAEHGGACPRWDVHMSFRTPGRILPQLVEMPDGSRYFTINRTVDRPSIGYRSQDHRLAVTLGCPVEHAESIVYADIYRLSDPGLPTPIGINCRLCPRQSCAQRAHQPIHLELPIDEKRRGQTRFES